MSTAGKIKNLFTASNVKVHSKVDDRILNAALTALGESQKASSIPVEPQTWRTIVNYPILKLAAAALIIIAAGLAISLWDKPASGAYSVEQTIEAMRNVSTIHCFITTFMEEKYEAWIEVDTKTGDYKNVFMDSPEVTKVATPNGISAYYKNTNEVSYFKLNSTLVYEMYFKPLIQEIADSAMSNSISKIDIIEGRGEKPVITVTLDKDESTLEWKVDADTKLPISMSLMSKEVLLPTKFNQSINYVSFNVPLPDGIFDFQIPKGAKVKGK
jgi:outer membrane lipoprotein-sorting protein